MTDWLGRALGAVAGIKFGPGVLGRMGSVVIATVIMLGILGAVAVESTKDVNVVVLGMCLIGVLAIIFLLISVLYAFKNPEAAAMESAHFLKHRQTEMAAARVIEGRARIVTPQIASNPAAPVEGEGG